MGMFPGSTSGRKERLRGQMGVRSSEGTSGWMMEPPADRLYAVLPVGVLMISPSAMAYVRCREDTEMEMWARCGAAPRWRMISLRACVGEAGGVMRSPAGE